MPNSLQSVVPRLLAQGLMALREMCVTPRVVNRGYERMAGQMGSKVDVPIPSRIAAVDVVPANIPPTTADIEPEHVSIELNNWKEAAFYMTDKEILEVMSGTIPMQASEAVRAMANAIDVQVLGNYVDLYGYAGTPGMAPFREANNVTEATAVRKVLNEQLAPPDNRCVILDPEAEANALSQRAFQDASWRGDAAGIMKGDIGEKFGMKWKMSQNILSHTNGAGSGYVVDGASQAVGSKSLTVKTGTGALARGTIFKIQNDDQSYVMTESYAATTTTIAISPGLKKSPGDAATITPVANHTVNLGLHRDCIALAMRPLERVPNELGGGFSMSAVDNVSGLVLRLEVTREHKRTRWAFDALWGSAVIRPELGCRLLG